MPATHSFDFEHDDYSYGAKLQTTSKHHAIVIDAMPDLEFRVDLKDLAKITVALPSDKKGRRPVIGVTPESVPILLDALAAAPV